MESSPNFSNQSLENAITGLRIGWVAKSLDLDTTITDNSVLSSSQKNDVKDTINNIAYLNVGRYLNDVVRHTASIINASIIPVTPGIEEFPQASFIELMQLVQTLQDTIPTLYGVTAIEKGRSVDDHFGILNNKFSTTEDSTKPVFTSLNESITYINNASLATETALGNAIDALKNFIAGVAGDSTDFQQTLNTFAAAVATANTNFDSALQAHPYSIKRTQMIADRDTIETQKTLENSNITSLRTYTESLSDFSAYVGLADDEKLRDLMVSVAQNSNWKTYFTDYLKNFNNQNPLLTTSEDSDKSALIDKVLADIGLPDVEDPKDFKAVASKAMKDNRIDTKNFSGRTSEQIITLSCEQLGLATAKRLIEDQSARLLNNMNQNDRDIIASQVDTNQDTETLS